MTIPACPTCKELTQKSSVYHDGSSTTCMGFSEFRDEDGVQHYHDPNTTFSDFHCSQGHRFQTKHKSKCSTPSCNWSYLQEDQHEEADPSAV